MMNGQNASVEWTPLSFPENDPLPDRMLVTCCVGLGASAFSAAWECIFAYIQQDILQQHEYFTYQVCRRFSFRKGVRVSTIWLGDVLEMPHSQSSLGQTVIGNFSNPKLRHAATTLGSVSQVPGLSLSR